MQPQKDHATVRFSLRPSARTSVCFWISIPDLLETVCVHCLCRERGWRVSHAIASYVSNVG